LEVNFLDELLQEVDLKEEEQTEAYFDLLLLKIKRLTKQIKYYLHNINIISSQFIITITVFK